MGFVIATMFLNFAGLTIIIPVIPYIVERYTHNVALYVGLIMSAGALAQFVASPALGYLSDNYGRRPILLWSLLGGTIGFVVFGIAGSLWMLFLGRIIDGLTAGDTPAMFAYIADVTEPKERGRLYGILGAAGGFGFIVGPAIGGLAAQVSLSMPLYIAAVLAVLNAVWGYFVMPESLSEENRVKKFDAKHLNPFKQFQLVFSTLPLRVLFLSSFLFFIGLVMQQSNFSVFLKDILKFGPGQIGIVLTVVGIVDIFSQGYLTGKLLPKLGEMKLIVAGLLFTAVGMLMIGSIALFPSIILLYAAITVYDIGDGLFEPSMAGLISNVTPPDMQGRIQGSNQATQSLARILAPLIAATLYFIFPSVPYVGSAVLMIVALIVMIIFRSSFKKHSV